MSNLPRQHVAVVWCPISPAAFNMSKQAKTARVGSSVCTKGGKPKTSVRSGKSMENGLNQRIKQIESQEFHDFTHFKDQMISNVKQTNRDRYT
jgi:hypothetical protein